MQNKCNKFIHPWKLLNSYRSISLQTFFKSSYLRNKTLASSLCFHHPSICLSQWLQSAVTYNSCVTSVQNRRYFSRWEHEVDAVRKTHAKWEGAVFLLLSRQLRARLRLLAVSLFSSFVEQNVRDTQMTTRVTEGARRERHKKRAYLFSSWTADLVSHVSLAASPFDARARVHSPHSIWRKRETACSLCSPEEREKLAPALQAVV